MQPTSPADIDRAVAALTSRADAWVRLGIRPRMELLRGLRRRVAACASTWVATSLSVKRLPPDSPNAGEEWLSGPYAVLTWADAHLEALARIDSGATTWRPQQLRSGPRGEAVVDVLPARVSDRLFLGGYRGEVHMQPGVTMRNLAEHTAGWYRRAPREGQVCAVLGAGNITSITPLDMLYKLYAEGDVVIAKMNPVNEAIGPVLEQVFSEYLAEGFVRFVYGDGEVGACLTGHAGVGAIHVTGSKRTHDAIAFGTGARGDERRRRNEPVLDKPISSELGGVSPTIIVPGPWSDADLEFQAEHVATQKLSNAGFNCAACQVLVMPADWTRSARFLDLVDRAMKNAPPRSAYYPGAADRFRDALEHHDHSVVMSRDGLRAHLRGVPADAASGAFSNEFFAPVLASTQLPGGAPEAGDFLDSAVAFANEALHGTLSANVIVHPRTEAALGERFEHALARLRYGCVGVNVWSALGFLTPSAPWGAYPGASLDQVESGRGVVHNALLLDSPRQTVVRGPFRPFPRAWSAGEFHLAPTPPWFIANATGARTSRLITEFMARGDLTLLPPLFVSALRG